MTDKVVFEDDGLPLFAATLTPHRSMGRRGFMILMGLIAGLCLFPGAIFLSMGAWPVFGFLGLDIVIIYWALRRSFFAARAFETVILTREALVIQHTTAGGVKREFVLDPAWTRLNLVKSEDGVEDIIVKTRDQAVAIGRFLPPNEKESFAVAFAPKLRAASLLMQ